MLVCLLIQISVRSKRAVKKGIIKYGKTKVMFYSMVYSFIFGGEKKNIETKTNCWDNYCNYLILSVNRLLPSHANIQSYE